MKTSTVFTRTLAFLLVLSLCAAFFTTMPLVSFANKTTTSEEEIKTEIIDDNDSRIQYAGKWQLLSRPANTALYGGTIHFLENADVTADATVTLTFVGTGVELCTIKNKDRGMLEVLIDGKSYGTADTYATAYTTGATSFSIDGIPYGTHTLVLKPGQKNTASTGYKVELDYIKVLNSYKEPEISIDLQVLRTDANTVVLTWNVVSGKSVTYNIYRQVGDGETELFASGLKNTFYVDSTAKDYLGRVSYQISAVMEGDKIAESTVVSEPVFVKAGMVDDNDPSLQYAGKWGLYKNSRFYNGTTHYLNTGDAVADATITLNFIGTGVELYSYNRSAGGMIEVLIDGESVGISDTYIPGTEAVVGKTFEVTDLPYGYHTLVLKPAGQKNPASSSYKLEYDYIKILDPYVNPGKIDANDTAVSYTGTWSLYAKNTNNYDSTLNIANAAEDASSSATLHFVGTGIEVYALKSYSKSGMFEVFIDGDSYGKVDTYSATTQYQARCFEIHNLEYGHHTITIQVLQEKNPASSGYTVELDAFNVLDANIATGEGIVCPIGSAEVSGATLKTVQNVSFVDFGSNKANSFVTYTVTVEKAGNYYLGLLYNTTGNRPLNVSVNGGAEQALTFVKNSDSWGSNTTATNIIWSSQIVSATLERGQNTVTFALNGTSGGPLISDLSVWYASEWMTSKDAPIVSSTREIYAIACPSGFDGYGYDVGSAGSVAWNVYVPVDSYYKLTFAYSTSAGDAGRPITVLADGVEIETIVRAKTGSGYGSAWKFLTTKEFFLEEGESLLTLQFSGGSFIGGIRLEYGEAAPEAVIADATIQATVTGKDATVVLLGQDDVKIGSVESNGTAIFTVKGLTEGTYTYSLKQDATNMNGWAYDTSVKEITVVVDGEGKVTVTGDATFNNVYVAETSSGSTADEVIFKGFYKGPSLNSEIVEDETGKLWYEVNGVRTDVGLFMLNDQYYCTSYDGSILTGEYYVWKTAEGLESLKGWRYFADDGAMLDGIVDGYYYEQGKPTEKGLFKAADGKYYVAQYDGKIIKGKYYVWKIDETANDLEVGWYYFDETTGEILNGIVDCYYYVNGKRTEMGLFRYTDGNYYVAQYNGKIMKDEYYVWKIHESAGDMKAGWYFFDEAGKMIVK